VLYARIESKSDIGFYVATIAWAAPLLRANQRFRTIISPVEGGMRFVEERSIDGKPWEVTEDYRYRRAQ